MITVVVAQGQSVEVHTEEGSFIVSHGKTKVTVKCADETGADDVGRQKILWQKTVQASKDTTDAVATQGVQGRAAQQLPRNEAQQRVQQTINQQNQQDQE